MKRLPIMIDTDPGIDDAFALMYAFLNPNFDVRLVSSVSGNVPIDVTTHNLQKLVTLSPYTIPVAKGAPNPLKRTPIYASHIHGEDGFAGVHLDAAIQQLVNEDAVLEMAHILNTSSEPITLVALGPLTNIAHLITRYPECISKIERITFMGGGLDHGNVTPYAEFNIYADPDAASVVLNTSVPITMAGLDVTECSNIESTHVDQLRALPMPVHFLGELIYGFNKGQLPEGMKRNLHDVVPLMQLLHPEYFTIEAHTLSVNCDSKSTHFGQTLVDHSNKSNPVDVILDVRVDQFRDNLMSILTHSSNH